MKAIKNIKQRGFTLIELLVVIGLLGILLAITLVALNPRRNFQQANDTQRQSDVNAILNAINQYAAQNHGQLPTGITNAAQPISDAGADICSSLVPTFIAAMPHDPTSGSYTDCSTYTTGYTVVATSSANGDRVTVAAPDAEIQSSISVTR